MGDQTIRGTLARGLIVPLMIGRAEDSGSESLRLQPAILTPTAKMSVIPAHIALAQLIGLDPSSGEPKLQGEAKVHYGFFQPPEVFFMSTCVMKVVDLPPGHDLILLGLDQIAHGKLTIDGPAGTWEWRLSPHEPA